MVLGRMLLNKLFSILSNALKPRALRLISLHPDEVIQVYNFLKKMGFKILILKNNIVYAEKY